MSNHKSAFLLLVLIVSCVSKDPSLQHSQRGKDIGVFADVPNDLPVEFYEDVDDCEGCVEDVDFDQDYLNCVPVERALTGDLQTDILGVWFEPYDKIDGVIPVVEIRDDQTIRRVYEPANDEDNNRIRTTEYLLDDRTFSDPWWGERVISTVTPSYLIWEGLETPLVKVACSGFGFGETILPSGGVCSCNPSQTCVSFGDYAARGELCVLR